MQVRVATSDDESQIIDMLREFMVFEKADLLTDIEFKDMFRTVLAQPERTMFLIAEVGWKGHRHDHNGLPL